MTPQYIRTNYINFYALHAYTGHYKTSGTVDAPDLEFINSMPAAPILILLVCVFLQYRCHFTFSDRLNQEKNRSFFGGNHERS